MTALSGDGGVLVYNFDEFDAMQLRCRVAHMRIGFALCALYYGALGPKSKRKKMKKERRTQLKFCTPCSAKNNFSKSSFKHVYSVFFFYIKIIYFYFFCLFTYLFVCFFYLSLFVFLQSICFEKILLLKLLISKKKTK